MSKIKQAFMTLVTSENTEEQTAAIETIKQMKFPKIAVTAAPVSQVKKIENAKDEFVYDIGMTNSENPWFFANDVLVHNSCYFSAYPPLKKEIETGKIPWEKEDVIEFYDSIGETVNSTFPDFMYANFHVPRARGEVIKSGREIVAINGLFITKKRYAVLYIDKEGKRADVNGKPGKIKAMGLDLKRSDTPVVIQNFLSTVLEKLLTDVPVPEILEYIKEFRSEFKSRPGWEKGSPKRANNITEYLSKLEKAGKVTIPGHVRASMNWNTLRRMYNDKYSLEITDGAKVIVCKLKDNPLGYTSVAYPVDEMRLPQWFKDLPFDDSAMENSVIDEKLENLIGVLNWDLQETRIDNAFGSLFDFE